MASIQKRGTSWFAQIRRAGHKSVSKSFPTKSLANEWARKIESEMDALSFRDVRGLNSITFGDLIDRYRLEMETVRPFGKNKLGVLKFLKAALGVVPLADLTAERLNKFVAERRASGAGGVTVNIDLIYIAGILKTARHIWKYPVDPAIVVETRAYLNHLGVSTRSKERTRRPTTEEIEQLKSHFAAKPRSQIPMPDVIDFAVATAMRLGEIVRIRWEDLNEQDRTVVIRDRKHPQEKLGNDQEVPLLSVAFDIVKRQPRVAGEPRIFPLVGTTITTNFHRATRRLGIEDLVFHDLRHEGVSRLFEAGYTIEQVALVSGHRDWKMLARYTQIKAKDLHKISAARNDNSA